MTALTRHLCLSFILWFALTAHAFAAAPSAAAGYELKVSIDRADQI